MDLIILYLQMNPKSFILAHRCLSLLNSSSEFPVPWWISSSTHSSGTLSAIIQNLFLLMYSFSVCSLLIQLQTFLGLIDHFHYLVFFHKWPELGLEPNSGWLQRPSFETTSGQYSSPDFTSLDQPWHGKIHDFLREALPSPSLLLSSPGRKTEVFLWLTSSEEWALLADHDDLGTHVLAGLLNCQISLFIDVDDWDRGVQTPTSRDGGDNSAGQDCKRKRFWNNGTVKASVSRTERNCTFL